MNRVIVSKFGGGLRADEGALADAERVKQAVEIIKSDPARRYVVVAAPGSSADGSIKVTDMLYICQSLFTNKENYQEVLDKIIYRFDDIVKGLGIDFDLDSEISSLKKSLLLGKVDKTVSHGERIMAKIFAAYMGWEYVDASKLIFFNKDSTLNEEKTFSTASEVLNGIEHAIIPGFYGVMPNGDIKVFPRGGSDITGAVIARAVNADVYEKWTEKSKIYIADPKIIPDSEIIRQITYNEMRELTHVGGVNMLHEDVILLLQDVKIPINIRSVSNPDSQGTMIMSKIPEGTRKITACIAGNRNFKIIKVRKYGMNKMPGAGAKFFEVLGRHGIPFEHCLSGIDTMVAVLKSPKFDLRRNDILREIDEALKPDSVKIEKDLSIVAVVGEGMGTIKGTFAKIFNAIADASIKVRMIDEGSDDCNMLLGVYDEDFEDAVKAIYNSMI
ncbi:MAG: aspartate kinase [Synergistaceae bacterium]|nr:aspartate kinase [Synergistaceae bacterium]